MENFSMAKTPNFSPAEATRVVELYDQHGNSKEAIVLITAKMNEEFETSRNERMILGKLINSTRENEDGEIVPVYTARDVVVKTPVDKGPTKTDLLATLEAKIGNGFDATPLSGATKVGIESVITAFDNVQAVA
jgi:hypothetical protein